MRSLPVPSPTPILPRSMLYLVDGWRRIRHMLFFLVLALPLAGLLQQEHQADDPEGKTGDKHNMCKNPRH